MVLFLEFPVTKTLDPADLGVVTWLRRMATHDECRRNARSTCCLLPTAYFRTSVP